MGTEAVKAFRRTWEPRAKRASSPALQKQGADSARASEPPPGGSEGTRNSGIAPKASPANPLPRPSEAALRVHADGGTEVRRTSGIRRKPQMGPSLDELVKTASSPSDEVPTQPHGRRGAHVVNSLASEPGQAPQLRTTGWIEVSAQASSGGLVQKTFGAPNKRNAREPTDHDVQIISVYAPPPLPVRGREALGFVQVDASEIEIVFEDSRDASDAILETQVIPFVEDARPSRLRRSLIMAGVLALSGVAGMAAYTFAPKLAGMLRLPASVAAVSDASKPIPTPVARPTLTVATPVVPSLAPVAEEPREVAVTEAVSADATQAAAEPAEAAAAPSGSVEILAPTPSDSAEKRAVDDSEGKVQARAKHKKNRRFRARHKRARARARVDASDALATSEK